MPVCRDSSAAVSFRSSIHALSTSGAALKLRMAALLFVEQLAQKLLIDRVRLFFIRRNQPRNLL